MFAKNLESVLSQYVEKSDLSRPETADMSERFESLRGSGLLPRGRENRSKRLNPKEIAAAILGLVPVSPKWSGHAALVLHDLRPVGGPDASINGTKNLTAFIEHLLSAEKAREGLISLTISVAESGMNVSGFAIAVFQHNEHRQQVAFVSKMAVSQFQPGMELTVDIEALHSEMSRCVVFNRKFFNRISVAIETSLHFPAVPDGNGSEYDAEEVTAARYKELGATPASRFLNIGVDTQVTWPKKEMKISFDGHQLVLMPKTKANIQSIHVDLHANQLTDTQALTVINRLLSLLSWCDDQFAISQGGWAGNPVPVAVPKRDLAFATTNTWIFNRQVPPTDEVRRALALYREGKNAEAANLSSYAVLSYFKIIEIRKKSSEKVKKWIAVNFSVATFSITEDIGFKKFLAACGDETPTDYIYDSCRLAVAHASVKRPSDADDSNEIARLYSASHVLRLLARRFITAELQTSDSIYSGN